MENKAGYCPIRRSKCIADCMWQMGGMCAVAQLAGQTRRQGDELYALTEFLLHGPDAFEQEGPKEADQA